MAQNTDRRSEPATTVCSQLWAESRFGKVSSRHVALEYRTVERFGSVCSSRQGKLPNVCEWTVAERAKRWERYPRRVLHVVLEPAEPSILECLWAFLGAGVFDRCPGLEWRLIVE
jgi:hypothetical protein